MIRIEHLFVSPGHNFFGHYGKPPGEHPTVAVPRVECVAGRGIRGDRFFDHKEDYKGQITFFAMEVYEELLRTLPVEPQQPPTQGAEGSGAGTEGRTEPASRRAPASRSGPASRPGPEVFRRNVLTRGVDLNTLIGREFEIQGVRFEGAAECSPCFWMDRAFAPGAEEALEGRGGLRARIRTDGELTVNAGSGAGLESAGDRTPIGK